MSETVYCYDGYHGTSLDAYHNIKKDTFKYEYRKDHWLGNGIYFYQDDFDEAEWFSKQCKNVKYGGQESCVLRCLIKAYEGRVLNLSTGFGWEIFKKRYQEVKSLSLEYGIEVSGNAEKIIMCTICDSFDEEFDVIIKTFSQNNKKRKNDDVSKYLSPQNIQICVKKVNCIVSMNKVERG